MKGPNMKRSICSSSSCSNAASNESVKSQEVQTKQDEDELPHLPDIIVHKIFRLLPTKFAVRSSIVSKQWESVWSLGGIPFLDFDDEADLVDVDDGRNMRFIHFVETCLRRFDTNNKILESFKLRMRRYNSELKDESTRIDKWLSFALERCVKELGISIRRKHDDVDESTYYSIPQTIFNSRFLTSLRLEHVIMKRNRPISLPALKTMSLYAVMFDCRMSYDDSIWKDCPSIEHLSLTSCTFTSTNWWTHISSIAVISSSLKSLQVMHCKFSVLRVEAENLESFICTSDDLYGIRLLSECSKLKYINVNSLHMFSIQISVRCRDKLMASIDTPAVRIVIYDGYPLPSDAISMKIAPHPSTAILRLHRDDEDEEEEEAQCVHFPAWREFLENFDCCDKVKLDIRHDDIAKALTFPESFRKSSSPPLPNVKKLEILIEKLGCPQTKATMFDFMNSLRWMAPCAMVNVIYGKDVDDDDDDDDDDGSSEDDDDE